MPASCRTCSCEPLAPESTIICNELNPLWSVLILSISDLLTLLVVCVHISIILLYLSASVIRPCSNSLNTSATFLFDSATRLTFSSGIIISLKLIDIPAAVA